METFGQRRFRSHMVLSILVAMIVGVTEISGFSYLDSLSSQTPPASDPPKTTTTTATLPKTSGYLDSLGGTPSDATSVSSATTPIAEEIPFEEYGGTDIGTSDDEFFETTTTTMATTLTDSVTSGRDGAEEETKSAATAAGATATSAYFLEQYNKQNAFAAKRKKRLSQEVAFYEPPTQEDGSLMEESKSLATAEEKTSSDDETDMSEAQQLMKKVKEAGTAGVISYALWELGFWALSVPVCAFGYYQYTGHWPDLSDPEDQKKLGAEAFAFVNVARFAVPLRIGLALSTTPWIDKTIVQRFANKNKNSNEDE